MPAEIADDILDEAIQMLSIITRLVHEIIYHRKLQKVCIFTGGTYVLPRSVFLSRMHLLLNMEINKSCLLIDKK